MPLSLTPLTLRDRLCQLLRCCPVSGPAVQLRFRLDLFPPDTEGGLIAFDPQGAFMLLMTSTQKATLSLDPRDNRNHPAPLDGVPAWSVADPSVATVTPAADGLSADITAVGVGTTQVNVVADARIGPDTKELAGVLDVQISAAEAVTLGITASTPVEQ